jgi:hypothetical protein
MLAKGCLGGVGRVLVSLFGATGRRSCCSLIDAVGWALGWAGWARIVTITLLIGQACAIYLNHDAIGIRVLDQWRDQGEVTERTIRFNRPKGTRRSNDGDSFYVIE